VLIPPEWRVGVHYVGRTKKDWDGFYWEKEGEKSWTNAMILGWRLKPPQGPGRGKESKKQY